MKKRFFALLLALMMTTVVALADDGSEDIMKQLKQDGFSGDIDAIDRAAKSVLMLEVFDENDQLFATGSGFVAFDNSTLVTNYHVVEDSSWIRANSDDGYQYTVTKIYVADEEKDIAICGFERATDLVPLEFHEGEELKRAQPVVAIGSPKGIKNLVSLGNISALYEEWGVQWIQFTAPISSGSSGGALFDDEGRIIGVTSATYNDEMAQNINYAVHYDEVLNLYAHWDGVERDLSEHAEAIAVDSGSSETPGAEYEELKRGDISTKVVKLQKALAALGYYSGNADGIFGEGTESAVIAFNLANFGEESGVADSQMQQLLYEGEPLAYGEQAEPETEDEPEAEPETEADAEYEELKRGDFSTAVIKLQKDLAVLGYYTGTADGMFDAETEQAVITFNQIYFGTDSPVASAEMQSKLHSMIIGLQEASSGLHMASVFPTYTKNTDTNTLEVTFAIENNSDRTVTECTVYAYASGDDMVNIYSPNVYSYREQTPIAPGETIDSAVFQLEDLDKITVVFAGIASYTYEDGTGVTVDPMEIEYSAWYID